MSMWVGSVELGGTNALVSAGAAPDDLAAVTHIPTTTPEETLPRIAAALARIQQQTRPFAAIGVASFGPAGVDPAAAPYGRILPTPKPGWSGADVLGALTGLGVPLVMETDVNAAAVAEAAIGAAQGMTSTAYITCGTGVGMGLCLDGAPVHGLMHPEAGHLRTLREPDDAFAGCCPWHGDCVEGMACGPAVSARTGRNPEDLSEDHPVWRTVGGYLGQLCGAATLIASPQRIILGGGVGRRPAVLKAARETFSAYLNGYIGADPVRQVDSFIVPPRLTHAGLVGALVLAQRLKG